MFVHSSPHGSGLVTLLRIASPASCCRDSKPDGPFLGVLTKYFFYFAVKFLKVACGF